MGKKYLDIKENSLESSVYNVLHGIQETVKKEKLDPVGKEDGDIDNDGDKDASDKYLAKRRKTVAKAIKKDKKEGNAFGMALKSAKEKGEKTFVVSGKTYKVEGLEDSPNTANSQHLCAKNVVHENWGNGTPISGQHAEPDAEGDIAWYDVMFEHGIEKGVSINELKVTKSESHHNHGGNGGKKKKKEEAELDEGKKEEYEKFFNAAMKKFKINSPADLKSDEEKKKFFDYIDKNYKSGAEKKTGKEDPTEKDKEEIGEALQKQYEFKMQSMRDAIQKVWEVSEASDREKIEMKRAHSAKTKPGKTMTGDDMSIVTVNPEIKD